MITFDEAKSRLLQRMRPVTDCETIAVRDALGRVLAHPAMALIDVPNHDNTAMDGYAIRHDDLSHEETTTLTVVADLPAGHYRDEPLHKGEAVRIMTGAPIPKGCDCIVIQEEVTRAGTAITFPSRQKPHNHIRRAGEDLCKGSEALPQGKQLTPADLGLLTSLGHARVEVLRKIKVAILSTGDEVITPGRPLQPGQVYDSNRAHLFGALTAMGNGVEILDLGTVRDERKPMEEALNRAALEADVVITSGGVSVGDFDLVKDVIDSLGNIDFWKVAMKPGKPQAYGRLGSAEFFGLPGNPVSSLAVFLLLVRPALLAMMGANPENEPQFQVPFRGTFHKKHDRRDFLRGHLHFDGKESWVETTGPQGSGILSSFSHANVFIILPETPMEIKTGDLVTVQWIRY